MLSQLASDAADQAHSRAVVTVIRPVPPSAGIVASLAPSVTPQREIVEGAVTVVVDDPQAPLKNAPIIIATMNSDRVNLEARMGNTAGVAAAAKC